MSFASSKLVVVCAEFRRACGGSQIIGSFSNAEGFILVGSDFSVLFEPSNAALFCGEFRRTWDCCSSFDGAVSGGEQMMIGVGSEKRLGP